MALVATLAHELGHVILLGGGLMEHSVKDMEPLTDLLTVFLGFGIFNANSAARFLQWQNERKQGWSMKRLGYLPEEIYGYALARFAHERGEHRPDMDQTPLHQRPQLLQKIGRMAGAKRTCTESTDWLIDKRQ